jgi:hypothetical protein
MHTIWYRFGLLAATAFVLAGCATSDPTKVPKHKEEYTLPPGEDARFSQPPAYPKDVLNQDRTPSGDTGQGKGKSGLGKAGGSGGFGTPGGNY